MNTALNIDTPAPTLLLWVAGIDFDAVCDEALGTARGVFAVNVEGNRVGPNAYDLSPCISQRAAELSILWIALSGLDNAGMSDKTYLILSCSSKPIVEFLNRKTPLAGEPPDVAGLQEQLTDLLSRFGKVVAFWRPAEAAVLACV